MTRRCGGGRCRPRPRPASWAAVPRRDGRRALRAGSRALCRYLLLLLMGPAGRRPALLLQLVLLATEAAARSAPRNRRGLLQLAGAVQCTTGRTPFAYLRYGCYCGLGGTGWPMDPADWCCFKHDCCYGEAEKAGCTPKFQSYTWECEDKAAKCEGIEDKCQKMACNCDRQAAKCLAKAPYTPKYLFWPDVLCGDHAPPCDDD